MATTATGHLTTTIGNASDESSGGRWKAFSPVQALPSFREKTCGANNLLSESMRTASRRSGGTI